MAEREMQPSEPSTAEQPDAARSLRSTSSSGTASGRGQGKQQGDRFDLVLQAILDLGVRFEACFEQHAERIAGASQAQDSDLLPRRLEPPDLRPGDSRPGGAGPGRLGPNEFGSGQRRGMSRGDQVTPGRRVSLVGGRGASARPITGVREKLLEMAETIATARRGMAAIRRCESEADPATDASTPFDAVVHAAASAVDITLAAAEHIDDAVGQLRGPGESDPSAQDRILKQIDDSIVRIFQACAVQDLAVQRVAKAFDAMKELERGLAAILDDRDRAENPAALDRACPQ